MKSLLSHTLSEPSPLSIHHEIFFSSSHNTVEDLTDQFISATTHEHELSSTTHLPNPKDAIFRPTLSFSLKPVPNR